MIDYRPPQVQSPDALTLISTSNGQITAGDNRWDALPRLPLERYLAIDWCDRRIIVRCAQVPPIEIDFSSLHRSPGKWVATTRPARAHNIFFLLATYPRRAHRLTGSALCEILEIDPTRWASVRTGYQTICSVIGALRSACGIRSFVTTGARNGQLRGYTIEAEYANGGIPLIARTVPFDEVDLHDWQDRYGFCPNSGSRSFDRLPILL